MKISVITATFNSENSIQRAIDSIDRQSYREIEHLIIDGASNDATLEIISARNAPFRIIISEPDRGIYDALNKGISHATGDVIGFLHSDDVFASNTTLEVIAEAFIKNPQVNAIYGDLEYIKNYKTTTPQRVRLWRSSRFIPGKSLKRGWMPPHPTLFLRSEVYRKLGYFDPSYKIAGDYEFVCRLFSDPHTKPLYLEKLLVSMSTGGASNRSLKNIALKSYEDFRAMRKHNIGGPLTLLYKNALKLSQFF